MSLFHWPLMTFAQAGCTNSSRIALVWSAYTDCLERSSRWLAAWHWPKTVTVWTHLDSPPTVDHKKCKARVASCGATALSNGSSSSNKQPGSHLKSTQGLLHRHCPGIAWQDFMIMMQGPKENDALANLACYLQRPTLRSLIKRPAETGQCAAMGGGSHDDDAGTRRN